MNDGDDVRKHINVLKVMREEFIRAGGKLDDQDFSYIILKSLPKSFEALVDSVFSRAETELLEPEVIGSILYTKSDRVSQNAGSSVAAAGSYKGPQGKNQKRKDDKADGKKNTSGGKKGKGRAETAREPPEKKRKRCKCGTGFHNESDCYWIHPEKIPESVKEMRKNQGSQNDNKIILYSQCPRETSHAFVTIHRAFGAKKLQGLPKKIWAFDSGSSAHMCNQRQAFITYEEFNDVHIVELGDAHCIPTHGIGSIILCCEVNGQIELQLTQVLYVPDLQMNLISQRCLDRNGCRTIIENGIYAVYYQDVEIIRSTNSTDLYFADFTVSYSQAEDVDTVMAASVQSDTVSTKSKTLYEWHCALGHTNVKNIKLLGKTTSSGVHVTSGNDMPICETCILGKQLTRISKGPSKPTTQPLELIHIDTDGPWQVGSLRTPGYFHQYRLVLCIT
jgi:hypothetical protein